MVVSGTVSKQLKFVTKIYRYIKVSVAFKLIYLVLSFAEKYFIS